MQKDKLIFSVVYGSVRSSRQGIKVARFIFNKIKERGHDTYLIDPLEYNRPLLDKLFKEYSEEKAPQHLKKLHNAFQKTDAYVIVSGEYNHTIPPALTNLLNYFREEYNRKPSGIVSYSNGPFGGVRAATQLRAFLAELGMSSIPPTFPISKLQESFDERGKSIDESYNKRIIKFLDELEWYAQALKSWRINKTNL